MDTRWQYLINTDFDTPDQDYSNNVYWHIFYASKRYFSQTFLCSQSCKNLILTLWVLQMILDFSE